MPGPAFTYDQIIERIIYATRDKNAGSTSLLAPSDEWYLRTWLADDNVTVSADISYAVPTTWPDDGSGFVYGTQETDWRPYALLAFELWDDLIATRLNAGTDSTANITLAFSTTTVNGGSYTAPQVTAVGDDQKFTAARIWLNPAWPEFGVTPAYYPELGTPAYGGRAFEDFLHEIGHALGLFHPGPYNAGDTPTPSYADANDAQFAQDTRQYTIMSYFNETNRSGGPETFADYKGWFAATPLLYDVAAIQAKYGADPTTRTGDTTYGYNATPDVPNALNFRFNPHPVICIYDAGGSDTLSFALTAQPVFINLGPGTFSNAFGMIGNIQIAFNTVIEKAVGSSGDDIIIGNAADNVLYGSLGNDNLLGLAGNDTLVGGSGEDVLDGGEGYDTVDYTSNTVRVIIDRMIGLAVGGDAFGDTFDSIENFVGSQYDDVMKGDADTNRFLGGDGNDELHGRGGNDFLLGGAGADSLNGGAGADALDGGDGYDTAFVDPGGSPIVLNLFTGVHGGDLAGDTYLSIECFVGSNFDDIMTDNNGVHVLAGGAGNDLLEGMGGNDLLFGGAGNDTLRGGEGDDTLYGGAGTNVYEGGNGYDRVSFADMTSGVAVDIGGGPFGFVATPLEVYSIEDFEGSAYDDSFYGRADQANYFYGGAGNDWLDGRGGGDVLRGESGDDTLVVRGTELSVDGGLGGFDTVRVGGTAGVFDWTLASFSVDGNGNVQVLNFEMARGGAGADRFVANAENLSFYGEGGNDTLWGGNGDNVLEGGAGADQLYFGGGFDYADYRSDTTGVLVDIRGFVSAYGDAAGDGWLDAPEGLLAGSGNDALGGSNGDNRILGRDGNDYIAGYYGADTLEGGAGDDLIEDHDQVVGAWFDLAPDIIDGGEGNDTLRVAGGGDTVAGGGGTDTLVMRFGGWGGAISFVTASDDGTVWDILFDGAETIASVSGVEVLDIQGSAQDDVLRSRLAGADTLTGGAGNDVLAGGAGDDSLDGGAGIDVAMFEGAAIGVPWVKNADGSWTITTALGGTDTLRDMEFADFINGQFNLLTGVFSGATMPSVPDMATVSDTGVSDTDNLTRVTRPIFTGIADVGARVTLFDGALAIGSGTTDAGGAWSITSAVLAAGLHQISARAVDLAGKTSWMTDALSVTIDPTAPSSPVPDLATASDSGASSTDNKTNDTTPIFTGLSEAHAHIALMAGTTELGSTVADGAGAWAIAASKLTHGQYVIRTVATDLAGNAGKASDGLTIFVDTTAVTPSRPDLFATSDTGISDADNITRQTTPVFTGKAEIGAVVSLFDGATLIGTRIASATGNWTIKASILSDGTHQITAQILDVAGNISALSDALTVVVDTVAPQTPTALDLRSASDSGVSSTDNITNVATPKIQGSGDAGSTIALLDGATVVGTTKVNAAGTWLLQVPTLADGVHAFSARASDAAGNLSATSTKLSVTVDTSVPMIPTLTDASLSSVSGLGSPSTMVTVSQGTTKLGAAVTDAVGRWTLPIALPAGLHALAMRGSDTAGNIGAPSSSISVELGTTGSDTLAGTSGADVMAGGPGDDTYQVNDVSDQPREATGDGNDTVFAALSFTLPEDSEIEFLQAASGAPGLTLTGNALANTITGGSGDDTLIGLGGTDTLTGGPGADLFRFLALGDSRPSATLRDTITDFLVLEGDLIGLDAIDANTTVAGDQAFTFVGASAFSGTAGQLRARVVGATTVILGDVNGDSAADFAINLAGAQALTAANFVL